MSFIPSGLDDTALIAESFHVADISPFLGIRKGIHTKTLAGLGKAFGCGRTVDLTRFEELYPFVKRCFSHTVKVIDTKHIIFREYVAGIFADEHLTLAHGQLQHVVGIVQAAEDRLPVIDIVFPLSQIKVHDVYGIHLAHFLIVVTQVDVLGNGFRHAVEHSMKIVQFAVVLHLDDEQPALGVLHEDVRAVELVHGICLV